MKKQMIVKVADVEGVKRDPPRVSRLLLSGKNVGAKNASMGLNVTEVGSMIPPHKHEESEELMYIISGHARLVIENDEGGEDVYEIGPDTAIYRGYAPEVGVVLLASAAQSPSVTESRYSAIYKLSQRR
jgi:CRP-like cAMP-binding protein